MGFSWTEQSLKWYEDAENNSNFYKKVVDLVEPYIKESSTALDIGCGSGGLTVELARKGLEVTAIDKATPAIAVLERRAQNEELNSVRALNVSFEELPCTEKYDMVLVCYVMGLIEDEYIDKILNHSRKYVTIIVPEEGTKNDFSAHRLFQRLGLDTSRLKQRCCKDVIPLLRAREVKYKLQLLEAEFGQNLKDMGEAKEFLKYYFKELGDKDVQLEEWLTGELRRSGGGSCYLPSTRRSAVFNIIKGRG